MELLSPAGNLEKLAYAYQYGADSAYIGIEDFSLRARAKNFHGPDFRELSKIKGKRKLYGAINIYFHDTDLDLLEQQIDRIRSMPLDALIISDPGVLRMLSSRIPHLPLHLSTQANCINSYSAAFYRDQGISRIILGRELSRHQIERIRREVPDVELEVFVHGAMCWAYSG